MTDTPDVLLVSPTADIAAGMRARLTDAGMRVTLVETFAAAREQLQSMPDLLISEVRLGPYNGLHLAMRAKASAIPAIILGEHGPGDGARDPETGRDLRPDRRGPAGPDGRPHCRRHSSPKSGQRPQHHSRGLSRLPVLPWL